MKKQFLLFVAAAFLSISSLMAQDAARMRQTPAERTKVAMEKLAKFDLKTDIRSEVEKVLTDFYTAQQNARQEMRAAGNNDRNAIMEKNKQLSSERDGKLQKLLSEEQYSKWMSEIEPSLRPQRAAASPTPAPAPAKN